MEQLKWSPLNLEGVSAFRLLEYAARLNIHEYQITGVSTFQHDPKAIDRISVAKLGKILMSTSI